LGVTDIGAPFHHVVAAGLGPVANPLELAARYVGNKGTHVFAGDGVAYDPNQATIVGFGSLTTDERKPFFKKFGWTQQINYLGILWDGTREWKAAGRLWRR
jgi:hypothetical protein